MAVHWRIGDGSCDFVALAVEFCSRCELHIEIDLAVKLTKALRVIDDPTLSLGYQFKLARYRYDLSILREGRSKPLLLIECDGRNFIQPKIAKRLTARKMHLRGEKGYCFCAFPAQRFFAISRLHKVRFESAAIESVPHAARLGRP